MKKHRIIFDKIKQILIEFENEFLKVDEENKMIIDSEGLWNTSDCEGLTVGETGVWITYDDRELTIGFEATHSHFDPNHDDMEEAVKLFFNLLTRRKKITEFIKGKYVFKSYTVIELDNSEYYDMGTTGQVFFPFWKKTKKRETLFEPIIEWSLLKDGVNEIIKIANSN